MLICSFNILADVFIENNTRFMNHWYPGITYSDLLMRNRFSTLIKYVKGDIVMLQEVTSHVKNKLKDVFGDVYDFMPLSLHKSDKYKTGNLTMLRKNRFHNVSHMTIAVDSYWSYGLTIANDLFIYNIHLSDISKETRIRHMHKIMSTIGDRKIIIGGDFNGDELSLHNLLKNKGFVSSSTYKGKNKKGTYLCENTILDYIYCRGLSKEESRIDNTLNPDSSECYPNTIKKYGSDHHPVYMKYH